MVRKFLAHKLVVETAKGLAHEAYAELMSANNELYADWKSQCEDLTPEAAELLFVELLYPKLIKAARHTLAKMLANPMLTHLHEDIYDALQKDYLLSAGRANSARQGERKLIEVNDHGEVTAKRSPLN